MLDFGALKQVPREKQEAGSRLEDALPAGRWAERVKLASEGRKVPAASSETQMPLAQHSSHLSSPKVF